MILASLILALGSVANAEIISAWGVTDFGNNMSLVGDLGWEGGYENDPWYTYDGSAYPYTDDGVSQQDNPRYGRGTAQDNWVLNGSTVGDGRMEVNFFNTDDDTFGVVISHSGGDSFYLLAHSSDATPPPVSEVNRGTALLYRVEDGVGELLDDTRISHNDEEWNNLIFQVNDGVLIAQMNGEKLFEVVDNDPLDPGLSGLYAYNNGYESGNSTAFVLNVDVNFFDDDADGVADDFDNCEFEPNEDQADEDGDGIGNLCDPDFGLDTGEPVDTGGDTNNGGGGGGGDFVPGGDVTLIGQCACSSSDAGSSAWGLLGLLGAIFFRRRD